ncbi:MAG: hypothetical protein R3E77_03145 [Steroidobacteraceae bacterium]
MADISESVIERRLSELELRYAALREKISWLRQQLSAADVDGAQANPTELRSQLERLLEKKKRTEAQLDALESGHAA